MAKETAMAHISALGNNQPTIVLTVNPEGTQATATVTPGADGRKMDKGAILDALAEANIVYGVMPEVIDLLVAIGAADNIVIAKGWAAVHGASARFEPLVV